MTFPEYSLTELTFKTDIKSILRGLNSIIGTNMGRARLKSLRVFNDKVSLLVAQIDLVKFILEADLEIPQNMKGIKYDEHSDEFSFIDSLTGDPKESLFLFEDATSEEYVQELNETNYLRKEKSHGYKDLLSAVLDSSQLNNSNLYLFHDNDNSYILNRALFPYPEHKSSFYYYSKLFKVEENFLSKDTNFVIVNRQDLSITTRDKVSDSDLSQMVLSVVHLYRK